MKLQGQLTADDLVRGLTINFYKPRSLMLCALFIAALALFAVKDHPHGATAWTLSLLPSLALLAFLILYSTVLAPYKIRRYFAQQKIFQQLTDIEINDEGIFTRNPMLALSLHWNHLVKYTARPDLIAVYSSPRTAHLFPRRWFTEAQYTEFQTLLTQHLGASTR